MSSDSKYEELQRQYSDIMYSLYVRGDVEEARANVLVSQLQKELTEFCLANGKDLKALEQYFSDIELRVAILASAG